MVDNKPNEEKQSKRFANADGNSTVVRDNRKSVSTGRITDCRNGQSNGNREIEFDIEKRKQKMYDRVQHEVAEYNAKYAGVGLQKLSPDAIRLRNKIEKHKQKYKKSRKELRGE